MRYKTSVETIFLRISQTILRTVRVSGNLKNTSKRKRDTKNSLKKSESETTVVYNTTH
jgi:hypothetical protein